MDRGDRRRLERVVVNLLDHASRHGKGLVRLGILRREGQARIEVDDAGPGVPAMAREHVFERFARGSPADRDTTDSGAGLGLALVTQHVRDHDGRAWVEDRPGGGARFVVSGVKRWVIAGCVLALSACGVSSQDEPQLIEESATTTTNPPSSTSSPVPPSVPSR